MKNFIALFREPDGRSIEHTTEEITTHQQDWKTWLETWKNTGNLVGGSSLTLEGNIILGKNRQVTQDIHRVGKEIVGGYLLIKADSLAEATTIISSCPIFDFDGYAEVREHK